jgi:hypothetical protein
MRDFLNRMNQRQAARRDNRRSVSGKAHSSWLRKRREAPMELWEQYRVASKARVRQATAQFQEDLHWQSLNIDPNDMEF